MRKNDLVKILMTMLLLTTALGTTACSSEPPVPEQQQAFLDMAKSVFEADLNTRQYLREARDAVSSGQEKRSKAVSALEAGQQVIKGMRGEVEHSYSPGEFAQVKDDMLKALDLRLQAYNELTRLYDEKKTDAGTKGDALLQESYEVMNRAQTHAESLRQS